MLQQTLIEHVKFIVTAKGILSDVYKMCTAVWEAASSNPADASFHDVLMREIVNYFKDAPPKAVAPALQRMNPDKQSHQLNIKNKLNELRLKNQSKYEQAKALLNFRSDRYNVAITGVSGSGKSTFINAIRGVVEGEDGYAKAQASGECTDEIGQYKFPGNLLCFSEFFDDVHYMRRLGLQK